MQTFTIELQEMKDLRHTLHKILNNITEDGVHYTPSIVCEINQRDIKNLFDLKNAMDSGLQAEKYEEYERKNQEYKKMSLAFKIKKESAI